METKKNRNIVEWAMHYHQIVLMITTVLIVFGIVGLYKTAIFHHLSKNQ